MSDRRLFRLATTGARLLVGTVVAAVFATAVVTGAAVAWPTVSRTPLTVSVDPAPADAVAVCTGPLLALGRDPDRADGLSVAGRESVVFGTRDEETSAVQSALAAPDVTDAQGPAVLTAQPRTRTAPEVAASGSATVDAADLAGYAASACQAPLLQSWIVGGSTTTGSSDLLLLGNPGNVPATVELTVYGATGAQVPPGGSDLVVAAGAQRIVPLAGLVLGEESPVVRVTATGAPVTAALQSSITRTLVPGGVDQETAIAAAATTQVIPGVTVTAEPGTQGASDATTVLRLLSADADTTAQVAVVNARGVAVSTQEVPLTAGLPAGVELAGLAVGTHSVRVDAPVGVVAAVWQATGFGAGSDFAWYAAAPALTADALVAVPDGPDPTLWVFNAADAPVTVDIESLFGAAPVQLSIPPAQAASRALATGQLYRLSTSAPTVHAMVSFVGDRALAGMPIQPEDAASPTVVVYP